MIPPITDPLGKHWKQPAAGEVLLDDTHAVMGQSAFNKLAEYSRSIPSGVYPGKMWRCVTQDGEHLLRWFGDSPDPAMCSKHQRKILIA